jgi:hypothetical protein
VREGEISEVGTFRVLLTDILIFDDEGVGDQCYWLNL